MSIEHIALIIFVLALIHTFSTHFFHTLADRFEEGSVGENFFHLLAEVEVVFGLWAAVFLMFYAHEHGLTATTTYLENKSFAECLFVFVIMACAATKPVMSLARNIILSLSQLLPISNSYSVFCITLTCGPILGSLITEPAAMTVTALLLSELFFSQNVSEKFKYATLGVLFVNISIGGVLTPFAAPPVLMVAGKWGWGMAYMLGTFGWRAALAVALNAVVLTAVLRSELKTIVFERSQTSIKMPFWVSGLHLMFMCFFVVFHKTPAVFISLFLFFMGVVQVTKEYQSELKLRESLLVAFFLGGLMVLGDHQTWWIAPILAKIQSLTLYFGTTALTAITDNAALTYLGSQAPDLTEEFKYFLVAGAVSGGGLTVIANAPNPAGYSILQGHFKGGIRALKLFLYALIPTLMACFWFLIGRI